MLEEIAAKQGGVVTCAQAVAALGRRELEAAVRRREWTTLTHGVLVSGVVAEKSESDPVLKHVLLGAARLARSRETAFLSHETAALMHGLLVLKTPAVPQITVPGPAPCTATHRSGRHVAPVPPGQRAVVRRLAVTSAERTVADLCRTPDDYAAAIVADSAVRQGIDPVRVRRILHGCQHWPHVIAARETVRIASSRSESPLESVALVWCRRQGLPTPRQQITVRRLNGRFVARVDLEWEELRTVGEVDGRIKYDGPGQDERRRDGKAVLFEEKRREDDLRDCGLEVVRGTWDDTRDGGAAFAARARRAFARAAQRIDPLTCRLVDEYPDAHRGPTAA